MRGGPRKGSGKPKLPYKTKQRRIPEPMLLEVETKIKEWKKANKMKTKLTKFEQGYICAVSNLIAGHGCNTDSWDTFRAIGIPLRDLLAMKSLPEFDKENLAHLKSFDNDYFGE